MTKERETMIIQAKFIGEDGSMGYKKNTVYKLSIYSTLGTYDFAIKRLDGTGFCPYSIEGFLANWTNIKTDLV